MVIQDQLSNVHHVDQFKSSPLFPLFQLHHYHQDNLIVVEHSMSPMKRSSSSSSSSTTTTTNTNKMITKSSFYIDDLLGINRTTINRKNNHHQSNLTNVHTNSNSISSTSSVSFKKNKRIRTIFTQKQLDILEKIFTHTQYMVGGQRAALSESLGLTDTQVKVWFQNRRIKQRKVSH